MTEVMIVLLVISVLLGLANLMGMTSLRRSVQDIDRRVTRLEAQHEKAISTNDIRGIYERLASTEGQMQTVTDLLRAIQRHMLEIDDK